MENCSYRGTRNCDVMANNLPVNCELSDELDASTFKTKTEAGPVEILIGLVQPLPFE